MMRKRDIIIAGAGTGTLLAIFSLLFMGIVGDPGSLVGLLAIAFGMMLASALAVKKISQQIGCCDPSLKQLIPVSFLTFLLPIVGISFGAPNSDLDTLATIVLMGAIGGAFWSLPYVLWALVKKTNSSENEEE